MNSKATLEILEARIAPAFTGTFDLSAFIAPHADGGSTGDNAGFSVADAGDVNGDGQSDYLIGAPFASPGGVVDAGSAYVVFGKAGNLPVTTNLDALNGTTGFKIDGVINGANLGRAVAGAGDVNGDGFDDVIVGAPLANINANSGSGIAYVVFGGASPANVTTNQVSGLNGFAVFGTSPGDLCGISVGGAGDVNGDGFDDVLVGASGFDAPKAGGGTDIDAGGAVVIYGHAGAFISFTNFSQIGLGSVNPGFRITGESSSDNAGSAVSGAGDFNGDGFGDIIVGASGAVPPGGGSGTGAAYIVYGAKAVQSSFSLSTLTSDMGLKINGVAGGDDFGDSVAHAGDVNSDGFADVIVGASGSNANGNNSGEAYVVFGGKNLSSPMSAVNADLRLQGGGTNVLAGGSVSTAGDFNGDGYDDLLIGATNASLTEGQAYVVFGRPDGFQSPIDLSTLDGLTGIQIIGVTSGDDTGFSVAGGGDLNNDGFDDVLVSAPNAKIGSKTDAGTTYIVYGGNGDVKPVFSADGRTATYTDADGDLVTVKVNKGHLEQNDFLMTGENFLGGSTLQKLNLTGHTDLSLANLTITAKPQVIDGALRGDGLANIGAIDATGIALGKVNVKGDLGRINAGGGGFLLPAVKSLTANSFGDAREFTQNPTELNNVSLVIGTIGSLNVKTNVEGIQLLTGKIATTKIGGDVRSSSFFLAGDSSPKTNGAATVLKSFNVRGDFENSAIRGGVFLSGNADVRLGKITVGGDFIASNITAGVTAGNDQLFATDDDALFGGGSAALVSRIASVVIKGQAIGSVEPGGRFAIEAEQVGSVQVGAAKLALKKVAKDKMFALGGTGDLFVNEI